MNKEINFAMLDMMLRPAFCVSNGTITKCNTAAASLFVEPGAAISPLVLTGLEELETLKEGCLYLRLDLPGGPLGAAVTRMEDTLLFILDQNNGELQALSLAAKTLRDPVNNLLALSSALLPSALPEDDPKISELLARMSKGLHQIQRILGNMSDAGYAATLSRPEIRNIPGIFDEIFEKAAALLSLSGIRLQYEGLNQNLLGLIDGDQMERAVLNMLSNSLKFLPQDGTIHAVLTRRGDTLRLTIQDNGPGIGADTLGSLFSRYLRQPGIEDSRLGLGLGMVMIRSAAASHGGTVLVDQPENGGTRVTMTMKLRQPSGSKVQSPRCSIQAGQDQALIELSDFLSASLYKTK